MADVSLLNTGTPSGKLFLNPVVNILTANKVISGPSAGPVVTSQYSQTSTVTVTDTVLGSITDGATFVGSLTIPALPIGAVVKIKADGIASGSAASVNYALYIDGKQATVPTSFGNFSSTNVGVLIDSYITIKSASTASLILNAQMSGSAPNSNFQIAYAYDSTTSHQIDIFSNISAASLNNSFACGSFFVELSSVS